MDSTNFNNISFDLPKNKSNVIKVIGIGGGGSNAVNHMYSLGIKGVDFVICNTDAQALDSSPIPNKIQLGVTLTEGLGAGANPEVGEEAARESIEDIKTMLGTHTKMVFLTVGMGGGTGTGAAPVIAKVAREMDLLTIGIVTMPFTFEGKRRNDQAADGIDKLRGFVDSLVVINNNKLREVYGNLGFKAGFSKADEVLSTAARGIAEVITHHYTQNIDLRDAKTVLSNSGTAILGSATASGENRAEQAISSALDSPLLNDNKITGAKNVLLLIVSGSDEITIDEIGEINDFIQDEAKSNVNIIMGVGEDETLGDAIAVTIVATGFNKDQQHEISNVEAKKIIHTLEDEQGVTYNFGKESPISTPITTPIATPRETPKSVVDNVPVTNNTPIVHQLFDEEEMQEIAIIPTSEVIRNIEVIYDEVLAEDVSEDDFIITNVTPIEPLQEVKKEESPQDLAQQTSLTFDLPITTIEEAPIVKTTPEIRAIEVVAPEPVPVTEQVEEIVHFNLEDHNELEENLSSAKKKNKEEEVDEDVQFEVRTDTPKEVQQQVVVGHKEVSPLDLTISELQKHTQSRMAKMKNFNYKFSNKVNNMEDYDKIPAYKRMQVNLDDVPSSNEMKASRTTLNTEEGTINFRSNNSFLHDNVD
ncbi:MAG: cell division protein FtsZ [Flavobacteriaceae bacterium]|nr:MAG: cell division protein FtsZ [Flavobacteriaceae bacterium]